jgi:Na+-driven multidrug efflux pump
MPVQMPRYPTPGFVPIPPDSAAVRTQATAALIVSILLAMPCFVLPVFPAIVMAGIAHGRSRTNVPLARLLVRISWIWIALSVALAVAFVAWSIATSTPADRAPSPTPTATAAR